METFGINDTDKKIKEEKGKIIKIGEMLQSRNYEPEEEAIRGVSVSSAPAFGKIHLKSQSMNKTLNISGAVGNILSPEANKKTIDKSFNSHSKKRINSHSMFSQSRENRMEMQKIQSKVKN